MICAIWCSKAAMNFVPVPFPAWAAFFALLFTLLNRPGINASARTNEKILAAGMFVVIVIFFFYAVRYIFARLPVRRGGLLHSAVLQP